MKCPECGQWNSSSEGRCTSCGVELTSEAQKAVTDKIKMRKRVKKSLIYAILMILGPIASINAIYVSAKAKKVLSPGDEGWKGVVALRIIGWVETALWILIIGAAVISSIVGQ
jgi:hypothetical protein